MFPTVRDQHRKARRHETVTPLVLVLGLGLIGLHAVVVTAAALHSTGMRAAAAINVADRSPAIIPGCADFGPEEAAAGSEALQAAASADFVLGFVEFDRTPTELNSTPVLSSTACARPLWLG